MPMFIFTVCQAGAEPLLKQEITRLHPKWKFAYSRPGFVTFKVDEGDVAAVTDPAFRLGSVFARAYGISLGKEQGSPVELAKRVLERAQAEMPSTDGDSPSAAAPRAIHLWEREFHAPEEAPLGFVAGALTSDFEPVIRRAMADHGWGEVPLNTRERLKNGDRVLDLVILEASEIWIGWHPHSLEHSPFAGNDPQIQLPPGAPSRAYLKIEEAIEISQFPVQKGDLAVEIGSAPGGATYALLKRGLDVVGIDPGEMNPRLFEEFKGHFEHLQAPVAQVWKEDLPRGVQWLLLDMNTPPGMALYAADRILNFWPESLCGVFLTLKLNDLKMAREIPAWLKHVESMGIERLRGTQLKANRREICIYGMTRKGLARSYGQR